MKYYVKVVLKGYGSAKLREFLQKKENNFTVIKHNKISGDFDIVEGVDPTDKVIHANKEIVYWCVYNGNDLPPQEALKRIINCPATLEFLIGGNS